MLSFISMPIITIDPVICISRVIFPCFDIVHRNLGYFFSIIKISQATRNTKSMTKTFSEGLYHIYFWHHTSFWLTWWILHICIKYTKNKSTAHGCWTLDLFVSDIKMQAIYKVIHTSNLSTHWGQSFLQVYLVSS
jgi:hypothetical protein